MLKNFKRATLKSLKTTGVSTLVHNSRWRRQRLLILAYHGISIHDEHLWNGSMYLPREVFRARLATIANSGCTVLPLDEAVRRLYANDLPDRSVAITFDDGNFDYQHSAFPLLKEFGFPSTLYLTTFYSHYNKPIFGIFCEYLLWKGRRETLKLKPLTGGESRIALKDAAARKAAFRELENHVRAQKFSAEEKSAFAEALAKQLDLDYDALVEKRIMHLLAPEEVKQLAADGADIQLHTHRHRAPLDRELFLREIEDNRHSVQAMTGASPVHFCYPSGVYDSRFLPWLREAGIISATTCEMGFASRSSDQLLLPRFLDSAALSPIEFEGWLTGVSAALPRRRERKEPGRVSERMNTSSIKLGALKRLVPKPLKRAAKEALLDRRFRKAVRRIAELPLGVVPPRELLSDLSVGWGNEGFAAQTDYLEEVSRQAARTNGPVLECGSGLTTVMLGLLAGRRGVQTWSLEHFPKWQARVSSVLERFEIPKVQMCAAPLRSYGDFAWYAPPPEMPQEFQLVICDGPPGATAGGRYGLLPVMGERLPAGTVILLDDATRPGEVEALRRWMNEASLRVSSPDSHDFAVITLE